MIDEARSASSGSPDDTPVSDGPPPPRELPDLVPARMLNEFTYCPRLGYLEWVQGEWADSLDTHQGTFRHRRVDEADRKQFDAPDGGGTKQEDAFPPEPLHARSVMLSALGEGLVAKLDLLELDGDLATPVDYKRGRVPDVPEGAWEPERVQLCAQGLILCENGYTSNEGVLYFVESNRRVTIPFDDALVRRTRELLEHFRATAVLGEIPPPLVDSPKCPRCSLVGICLPDETNLLAEPERTTKDGTRRLLPARDDALPLYVQEQGDRLGKSGDRITVKRKRDVVREVKLKDVSQVCLFGNVQVSAQAIAELADRGIPVCHFSYGGWFRALTSGLVHKNVELRIAQFAIAADPRRSLEFARRFVFGKVKNSRTLLRRHLPELLRAPLQRLTGFAKQAEEADNADSLLGIEGMAAKVYFGGFFQLLEGGHAFDVDGRNRRPPTDPVNALLSFVYGLLVKELTVVCHAVGLDPMLGLYHRPRYGRPSLALDLAEEFRPLVADSTVLTLVNNGEVRESNFLERGGAVALTPAGRKSVIAAFERRLETLVTHPLFGYRVSYRRIPEVQTRLFARTLLGELDAYPNFLTR